VVVLSNKESSGLKQCSSCCQMISVSEFYRKGERSYSSCKSCVSKDRKQQYLGKNKVNDGPCNNIFIQLHKSPIGIDNNDLISLIESFLIEEMANEQRVNR
jgi:hypothetical protein